MSDPILSRRAFFKTTMGALVLAPFVRLRPRRPAVPEWLKTITKPATV